MQLEQNECLLADFEQMDLLDLHLLAELQKRCLLADYEQMDLLDLHLLADYEQMGLLDLHLLDLHLLDLHKICLLQLRGDRLLDLHLLDLHLQLQKKCLLADYELQKKCLLADYEQMDLHLQLQKKCLLADHKHHDSLLDLQKKCHKKCLQPLHRRRLDSMEHDHYRFQELNPAPGSPIARGGAGAHSWCG